MRILGICTLGRRERRRQTEGNCRHAGCECGQRSSRLRSSSFNENRAQRAARNAWPESGRALRKAGARRGGPQNMEAMRKAGQEKVA